MKASELMIGDWVYAIDIDNGEKHPCRANNLEYDYTNKRGDFCVDFYETGYEAEWPDVAFNVEPIPLTPEILEKNGFEKRRGGEFIYDEDDENIFMVYYPKSMNYNGIYDYIDISRGCVEIKELPIQYVHELQHALRLCGIKKEIKI